MNHYRKPDGSIWAFEADGSQAEAEQRCIDEGGIPCAAPVAAGPTFAESKAALLTAFRKDRELFLGRIAGIGMAAIVSGDTDLAAKVVAVRQALLDLTSNPAVLAATNMDDLELAMETAYDAAVLLGGVPLYLAFKKVDK